MSKRALLTAQSGMIYILLVVILGLIGCAPKKNVARIPVGYSAARTANLNELIERVNSHYAQIETFSVSHFQVKFTGGSIDAGYLKQYPSAKGYLITKRPHWIYVNILNPVTSSSLVTMASDSQNFQIWIPRENKYLMGKTDVRTSSKNPLHSVRPEHLLQAIMVEPLSLSVSGQIYLLEEAQDQKMKFYIIHEVVANPHNGQGCLRRKLWIERQNFGLVRQHYYDCGKLLSNIYYSDEILVKQGSFTSSIIMERIPEHYKIQLRFPNDKVRLNPNIEESSFHIAKPPKAEAVIVKGISLEDN